MESPHASPASACRHHSPAVSEPIAIVHRCSRPGDEDRDGDNGGGGCGNNDEGDGARLPRGRIRIENRRVRRTLSSSDDASSSSSSSSFRSGADGASSALSSSLLLRGGGGREVLHPVGSLPMHLRRPSASSRRRGGPGGGGCGSRGGLTSAGGAGGGGIGVGGSFLGPQSLPPPRAPFLSSKGGAEDRLSSMPTMVLPESAVARRNISDHSADVVPYGSLRESRFAPQHPQHRRHEQQHGRYGYVQRDGSDSLQGRGGIGGDRPSSFSSSALRFEPHSLPTAYGSGDGGFFGEKNKTDGKEQGAPYLKWRRARAAQVSDDTDRGETRQRRPTPGAGVTTAAIGTNLGIGGLLDEGGDGRIGLGAGDGTASLYVTSADGGSSHDSGVRIVSDPVAFPTDGVGDSYGGESTMDAGGGDPFPPSRGGYDVESTPLSSSLTALDILTSSYAMRGGTASSLSAASAAVEATTFGGGGRSGRRTDLFPVRSSAATFRNNFHNHGDVPPPLHEEPPAYGDGGTPSVLLSHSPFLPHASRGEAAMVFPAVDNGEGNDVGNDESDDEGNPDTFEAFDFELDE